jgi:hypothetical protein
MQQQDEKEKEREYTFLGGKRVAYCPFFILSGATYQHDPGLQYELR